MAAKPRYPKPDTDDDAGNDTGGRSDPESVGTPWGTYAFVMIVIVAVLLIVVLHLTGTIGPGANS